MNNNPSQIISRVFYWLTMHGELDVSMKFINLIEEHKHEKEIPIDTILRKMQVSIDINDMNYDEILSEFSEYCHKLVGEKESSWIVTNGRVINFSDISFSKNDFKLLEASESKRIETLLKEIPEANSDQILYASSYIASELSTSGSRINLSLDNLQTKHSSVFSEGINKNIEITAIIDPLSNDAQKISTLLTVMNDHFHFSIRLILTPKLSVSEMPLKSWYRYVLIPEMKFNPEKKLIPPKASFKQLSQEHILTMNMDVQETWLTGLTYSIYDLDNIKLSEVEGTNLEARYQLENIIVSGSCFAMNSNEPPRGLQLELKTKGNEEEQDTLVMASLGYYQLKSNPGIWYLNIAEGRHSEIYEFTEASPTQFYDQKVKSTIKPIDNKIPIHMMSFDGPYVFLKVSKRSGKENELLIEEPSSNGSVFSSISSLFSKEQNTTVNIFSVASGHMYERLLKIMILSVLKHTKSPVKFWFLKNYLSPQFKEYLPLMAKRYNFEVGLVAYQWPSWLHKQTVKMRKIWAYKVLFLDVLFPLKVNKIIFVDADQVCRTDMTELFNMNLEGKAVGYTPFCSDKPEMDGFRFWKGGYWGNYLRGKPYHISALYVVDIAKLRFDYAGDSYRMVYDSLAKDPNSLSNLDQDLPNYAQHQIPIFSLPQEWLWCEAWCSDNSKSKAKTIDLCNNPQTKENKIDSARRIVPEWNQYDEEHKKFEKEMREKKLLKF
jgi:UDP-glucose:glycoprotein glucosyltransferase